MNRAIRSAVPSESDPAIHEAFLVRRARRFDAVPEPLFPASGSEMIAARLAEARARRNAPVPPSDSAASSATSALLPAEPRRSSPRAGRNVSRVAYTEVGAAGIEPPTERL